MKLWLIKARDDLPDGDNPWNPWYDKCFGMVIRAETEEKAREIANENACDEICREYSGSFECPFVLVKYPYVWMSPKYSSCVELLQEGEEETILMDVRSA